MKKSLQDAIKAEQPLQIVGVIHALAAMMAEQTGFKALYLSGAGVANTMGLPDLGLTSLNDVIEQVSKITQATDLPLLVDADTGWGNPLNIRRAFNALERAGAAGAHIEDQQENKRCGHREKKHLVSTQEMVGRIKAALDGRESDQFMVIARTDSIANEGIQAALERAKAYEKAGADAVFVEAITEAAHYKTFTQALKIPVLANITEFGKTPLLTLQQLSEQGIKMALYPLSAFRAMNAAALQVYQTLKKEGSQQSVISSMQNRQDLYKILGYEAKEQELEQYLTLMENSHGSI